jgi:hypothetical protein
MVGAYQGLCSWNQLSSWEGQCSSRILSQRSKANHLVVKNIPSELCDEFAKLKIVANKEVVELEVGSSLLQEIRRGQVED